MKSKIKLLLGIKPRQAFAYHRYFSNIFRKRPSFLIIGSQKCGTTSLYNYLTKHPQILKARIKEIHFFNMNYNMSLKYYKSFFPLNINKNFITGEATPDYLDYPFAAKRCHDFLPNVKLIVVLRNPIDRAFSHFNFVQKYNSGEQKITFEKAINKEGVRMDLAFKNMNKDGYNSARDISNFGYVYKGKYVLHIKEWLKYYNLDNIYFVDFEELKNNPKIVTQNIYSFLNIDNQFVNSNFPKKNKTEYNNTMKAETRLLLKQIYSNYNLELEKLINMKFNWK